MKVCEKLQVELPLKLDKQGQTDIEDPLVLWTSRSQEVQ